MQKINRTIVNRRAKPISKLESKFCYTKTEMELGWRLFLPLKEEESIMDSEKEVI